VKEDCDGRDGDTWHTTLAEFYEYAEKRDSLEDVSVLSLRETTLTASNPSSL